jgi:glucose/arabinose dehydrogenase
MIRIRVLPLLLASVSCAQKGDCVLVDAFPAQAKFDKPVLLVHHPSDAAHYYVLQQEGIIYRIPRDGSKDERQVFLDWREPALSEVLDGGNWEEGLLGFAFDPDYERTRSFYIYYSQKAGEDDAAGAAGGDGNARRERLRRQSVIARLQTVERDGVPQGDPATEFVVMRIPQPYGNHNGGTIVFGPDRMLYVALGDGGAANDPHGNGQDLRSVLGKVLRIDVSRATPEQPYAIPADNPFVARGEGARGEIWTWGMRNPWRIAFDRETGELWCGDVGQNRYEEIHRLEKGGNYGWNRMEGRHPFPPERSEEDVPDDAILPIAEYGRKEGISVTGGHVYRGKAMPDLVGRYVYGDFGSGRIWCVREDREKFEHEVRLLASTGKQIASFAEDADGELFVLCFDGRIYRLARE